MERDAADIVAGVASDDSHPLQRIAIATLAWGFEEPFSSR